MMPVECKAEIVFMWADTFTLTESISRPPAAPDSGQRTLMNISGNSQFNHSGVTLVQAVTCGAEAFPVVKIESLPQLDQERITARRKLQGRTRQTMYEVR